MATVVNNNAGQSVLCSDNVNTLIFRRFLNATDIIGLSNLSFHGTRLMWSGDFVNLKKITSETFGLLGSWRSPGGSAKKFIGSNAEISITWYPGKLNSLLFHGKDGLVVQDKFKYLCEKQNLSHVIMQLDTDCCSVDASSEMDVVSIKLDQWHSNRNPNCWLF